MSKSGRVHTLLWIKRDKAELLPNSRRASFSGLKQLTMNNPKRSPYQTVTFARYQLLNREVPAIVV